MDKKVLFKILKQLLESMPRWILPIAAALACILYPQMNKVVIVPGKRFTELFGKEECFLRLAKRALSCSMYPRPSQR